MACREHRLRNPCRHRTGQPTRASRSRGHAGLACHARRGAPGRRRAPRHRSRSPARAAELDAGGRRDRERERATRGRVRRCTRRAHRAGRRPRPRLPDRHRAVRWLPGGDSGAGAGYAASTAVLAAAASRRRAERNRRRPRRDDPRAHRPAGTVQPSDRELPGSSAHSRRHGHARYRPAKSGRRHRARIP